MTDKKAQRKYCKDRLATLKKEERAAFSAVITDKLFRLPSYQKAATVFVYSSMPEEPDTSAIVRHSLSLGKKVFLPRIEGEKMQLIPYEEGGEMCLNEYGIEEPQGDAFFGKIDIAVLPLLGFDRTRARLGRGKGYYDRFLAGYDGTSVALAFSVQELDSVTAEPHDAKPDVILTEKDEI